MNPTQHPSNNRVLGAPKGWVQGDLLCSALAITDMVIEGQPCISSFWRPTQEEIAALINGGTVMLTVFGAGVPPVALVVVPRF